MQTIARNQVNKTIRNILPPAEAKRFFDVLTMLMLIDDNSSSASHQEQLERALHGNQEVANELLNIYRQLRAIGAPFSERVNAQKTVRSKKTLLNHLTDGESHLAIYPDVRF